MYNNKLKAIVLPVVIALAIVLGMGINSLLDRKEVPVNMSQRMIGSKLDYILNMINYSYVDSVDIHKIEEDAIPQILNDLDPHTVYIPAKDMQRVNEEMVGNFGGVGVQFYKYLDTVTVVKVVPGGPSEAAGLQDGDRIVKVNDSIVAGRNMNTDKIMSLMRGEIGTDVQLTIVRRGEKQPLIKNITRGKSGCTCPKRCCRRQSHGGLQQFRILSLRSLLYRRMRPLQRRNRAPRLFQQ